MISPSPLAVFVETICILQPARSMSGVMSVKLTRVPFSNETHAARELASAPTRLMSSVVVITSDL